MSQIVKLYRILTVTYLVASTAITRGHNLRFQLPFARTNPYKNSFFVRAIMLWNGLPSQSVHQPTLHQFNNLYADCLYNYL